MSKPISTRSASVFVEYDRRGERVRKFFEEAYKARGFYARKLREGKNPRVIGSRPDEDRATG